MAYDKMLAEKKKFLPKEGFNVVGEDDFEPPGERLYLLGNYSSKEEALAAKKEKEKENADKGNDMDKVHVYDSAGADVAGDGEGPPGGDDEDDGDDD